jgi:hypothetical protein
MPSWLWLRPSWVSEMVAALSISEHTARHHLENIYRQLGVNSRVAAARIATRTLSGLDTSLGLRHCSNAVMQMNDAAAEAPLVQQMKLRTDAAR